MSRKYVIGITGLASLILILGLVFFFPDMSVPTEQYLYPPFLVKEIEEDLGTPIEDPSNVISLKEIQAFTVPIKDVRDVSKIRSTGVLIETQEPDYVVILGDQKRIDAVRSLGFVLMEIKESDHKLRPIRVWVNSQEQYERVLRIGSDIWPGGDVPGYIVGREFDFQIQRLRDEGYKVEVCNPDNPWCVSTQPEDSGVTF